MRARRLTTLGGVVGLLLLAQSGAGLAQDHGLTMTQITTQQMPEGMGGLLDLAKTFGADVPMETRETIYLNSTGTIKRVTSEHGATIYNLDGFLIEINDENHTWERKTFAEYRAQFQQFTGTAGATTTGTVGRSPRLPTADPADMDLSLKISVEAKHERQDMNGFADAALFHQIMEVEMSGQSGQAPGMDGNFVVAMQVWAVDSGHFDLTALHEFDQKLAEELLGVPLSGSQDIAASMLNTPRARKMIEEFEAEMEELRGKEPVSTLTEVYMLRQGQVFDPTQAFQKKREDQDEPDQDAGGGGLFGRLRNLGALAQQGRGGADPGSEPAAGQSQTPMGGTQVDFVDYEHGAPDPALFEAPGPPYREISR